MNGYINFTMHNTSSSALRTFVSVMGDNHVAKNELIDAFNAGKNDRHVVAQLDFTGKVTDFFSGRVKERAVRLMNDFGRVLHQYTHAENDTEKDDNLRAAGNLAVELLKMVDAGNCVEFNKLLNYLMAQFERSNSNDAQTGHEPVTERPTAATSIVSTAEPIVATTALVRQIFKVDPKFIPAVEKNIIQDFEVQKPRETGERQFHRDRISKQKIAKKLQRNPDRHTEKPEATESPKAEGLTATEKALHKAERLVHQFNPNNPASAQKISREPKPVTFESRNPTPTRHETAGAAPQDSVENPFASAQKYMEVEIAALNEDNTNKVKAFDKDNAKKLADEEAQAIEKARQLKRTGDYVDWMSRRKTVRRE